MQGDKVRQQGIAAADELTASNDMLRGAVQALTREHSASCAAETASQEQLCQLQSALEALQAQVLPCNCSLRVLYGFSLRKVQTMLCKIAAWSC